MAAPTTAFTDNSTGTISSTGESNGLLLSVGKSTGANRVTFGFRGTFTSVVVAVRGHVTGLSATSYYPIPGVVAGSGLPVSNPVSISLTNSTNAALTFDTTGCDYVEVWVVSGTPTALTVDATQFQSDANTPPLIVQAQTSATSISANQTFTDNTVLYWGTGNDIGVAWDGTDLLASQAAPDSIVKWGVSGAGINHVFYGDTSTYDMTWDQSNDQLLFADNAKLAIGSGAGAAGDIAFNWDGTRLNVTQLTTNSEIRWGVDGAGIDQRWYGDTASAYMLWDQSADQCIFGGVASVSGLRVATSGATAITTTRAVTKADSGGVFTVSQAAAYTITVATPAGAGERYLFQLVSPGANNVAIVATGCTFEGTITIDAATIPATGSTLTFATGAAILGDNIELVSTSTTKFLVRAIGSGAGGITIS
jgi:hypothetical protein